MSATDWHWEYEYQNYDRLVGKGVFATIGYQMPVWHDTASITTAKTSGSSYATRQQNSSALILFNTPTWS